MKNNEHIPVFFESNDELVEITAVAMASICYNTKSFVDFYILDTGMHSFNKKLLESMKEKFDNFSIEYIPVDLKQFKDLKGYTARNFLDCYARLLIPELKPELDKAIYLDEDIIALDDISKLWNESLDGYEVGCVADIAYANYNIINKAQISSKQKYANGGVIFFNCKKWRENGTSKKALEIAKKYKHSLGAVIEDILNILYNNNQYKLLPFRYGYSELIDSSAQLGKDSTLSINYEMELHNVVIFHFSGMTKPWQFINNPYHSGSYKNFTIPFFSHFYFFAKMTPFYEGLMLKFLSKNNELMANKSISNLHQYLNLNTSMLSFKKKWVKLFSLIPLIKIKKKNKVRKYYLFGFLPLFQVKEK